jgi:hypothetical protein
LAVGEDVLEHHVIFSLARGFSLVAIDTLEVPFHVALLVTLQHLLMIDYGIQAWKIRAVPS